MSTMLYEVAAFTHIGAVKEEQQDRVLVESTIIENGVHSFRPSGECRCFVADGVGGAPAGWFAAEFVLSQIRLSVHFSDFPDRRVVVEKLRRINQGLISESSGDPEKQGCGTTLVGFVATAAHRTVVNSGAVSYTHLTLPTN